MGRRKTSKTTAPVVEVKQEVINESTEPERLSYRCSGNPTVDDVRTVFKIVEDADHPVTVEMTWAIKYRKDGKKLISRSIIEEYTPEDFFEKCIDGTYPK